MITINVHLSALDAEQAAAALPVTSELQRTASNTVAEVNAGPPAFDQGSASGTIDEVAPSSTAAPPVPSAAISGGSAPSDLSPVGSGLSDPASGSHATEGTWINAGAANIDIPATPQHSQED